MSRTVKQISELPLHWQDWYQEWDSSVPSGQHREHLRSDLSNEREWQQSYSAAFELFLYTTFKVMGLDPDFQPEVNGVNPDFYISDKSGCGVYVEAGAMFSSPLETELSYSSMAMPIWAEFKKLRSLDFIVRRASQSGNPSNVRARQVRHEIQQWIDQPDTEQVRLFLAHTTRIHKLFKFNDWNLEVEFRRKTPEEKDRLGATAVDLTGFSGGWSDNPADRLKKKLQEKSSQVRKTKSHCIVALTERQMEYSAEDVQTALFGGNVEYSFHSNGIENAGYP